MMGGPDQVLEVLQAVLQEMAESDDYAPPFRPDAVELVGKFTGRPRASDPTLHGKPEPLVIRLSMHDGSVYRLNLDWYQPEGQGG